MAKPRIPIPENPTELLALGKSCYTAHQAAGTKSPLAGIADDWTAMAPLITQAQADDAEAKRLERELEKVYERRNKVTGPLTELARRSKDILSGHFGPARIHEMGDFGYTVDATPKPPKPPKP